MTLQDIMQTQPVTAPPDTSLAQAQRQMVEHHIRHLPVVRKESLVGLVTDRDIRDALPSPATTLTKGEIHYQMDTLTIDSCMTTDVVAVQPETDCVQAARQLLESAFGCLPVLDHGQLVGIVTEIELLRGFLAAAVPAGDLMHVQDYLHTEPHTTGPDNLVVNVVQRMHALHIRHVPVVAEGGQLVGIITDRDVRQVHASDEPHLYRYEWTELLQKMRVKDAMTSSVLTVSGETPVGDAGQLLLDHRFGCLPVVGDDKVIVGIVTVTDLIRAYVQQHRS